jgi:hypothetical protein
MTWMFRGLAFLRFFWLCRSAWVLARRRGGVAYVAQTRHGVPECAIFVGVGRDAWRVSVRAVEEFRCLPGDNAKF